jgi:hypothetical protein
MASMAGSGRPSAIPRVAMDIEASHRQQVLPTPFNEEAIACGASRPLLSIRIGPIQISPFMKNKT